MIQQIEHENNWQCEICVQILYNSNLYTMHSDLFNVLNETCIRPHRIRLLFE